MKKTGHKAPTQIINRLCSCCSYETVLKVKIIQADISQKLSLQKYPLPLKTDQPGKHFKTFIWWEKFDCKKEKLKGSIHTIHGLAFQEKSKHFISVRKLNSITRFGKKSDNIKTCNLPLIKNKFKTPSTKKSLCVIQNKKKRQVFSSNIDSL